MKTFKGNLVLKKDTVFEESITVKGHITCKDGKRFSLRVAGDIDAGNIDAGNIVARDIDAWDIDAGNIVARDIDAWDIDAWDITARDIDAWDIDAWDITARDIDAWDITARDIICESRKNKTSGATTIAHIFIQEKSKLKRKEW